MLDFLQSIGEVLFGIIALIVLLVIIFLFLIFSFEISVLILKNTGFVISFLQ